MKKLLKAKMPRNVGQEIFESLQAIKAGQGVKIHLHAPDSIKQVRENLALSQSGFADVLHVSTRTLQAWEQGRRRPSGAALALLTIAAARPDVIRQVLQ